MFGPVARYIQLDPLQVSRSSWDDPAKADLEDCSVSVWAGMRVCGRGMRSMQIDAITSAAIIVTVMWLFALTTWPTVEFGAGTWSSSHSGCFSQGNSRQPVTL